MTFDPYSSGWRWTWDTVGVQGNSKKHRDPCTRVPITTPFQFQALRQRARELGLTVTEDVMLTLFRDIKRKFKQYVDHLGHMGLGQVCNQVEQSMSWIMKCGKGGSETLRPNVEPRAHVRCSGFV